MGPDFSETVHLIDHNSMYSVWEDDGKVTEIGQRTEAEAIDYVRRNGAKTVMIQRWVEAP